MISATTWRSKCIFCSRILTDSTFLTVANTVLAGTAQLVTIFRIIYRYKKACCWFDDIVGALATGCSLVGLVSFWFYSNGMSCFCSYGAGYVSTLTCRSRKDHSLESGSGDCVLGLYYDDYYRDLVCSPLFGWTRILKMTQAFSHWSLLNTYPNLSTWPPANSLRRSRPMFLDGHRPPCGARRPL